MAGTSEVIIGKTRSISLLSLGSKECLLKLFFKDLFYDFCAAVDCQGFVEFNRNLPTAGEAVRDLIVSLGSFYWRETLLLLESHSGINSGR